MWRSLFFAPANRMDLIAKLPRFPADNYVLDLEDGTPADRKEEGRAGLCEAVGILRREGVRGRVLVRVNEPSSDHLARDLDAVATLDVDGIVVPKCEDAAVLHRIGEMFAAIPPDGRGRCLVGGIESALGVLDVRDLVQASPLLQAVYFGAEDLTADIGATRTRAGTEVQYARQRVVMAAKAYRIAAIDQAVTEVRDKELFDGDCAEGRSFGYDGKICLTPSQVQWANVAFTPTDAELARARRLLEAFETASREGRGTIDFDGQMVDEPLVRRARWIVSAAEAATKQ